MRRAILQLECNPRPSRSLQMKIRLHYPRSFLKFTLLGFVVAGIPFLAGLFYSVVSLDRLAKDSQRVVYQGAQAVNGSRDMVEELTAMERGARQYAILGDDTLRVAYTQAHSRFVETSGALSGLAWTGQQLKLFGELVSGTEALHQALSEADFNAQAIKRQTRNFAHLVGIARHLSNQSHQLVDQEMSAMQARVETARSRVNWMLLGLVPLSILLVVGVPLLIAKPVRQIDAAIRRLRSGELSVPIKVDGPSDLEYLAERLDWMRQGLLEAEADKNRFLRHLSHELKTPLTALRESSDLLWDGSLGTLSANQREVVAILRQNSLRLQKLIEDLLAYRAMMASPLLVERQSTRMGDVVERVLEHQRAALMAKNIRVETSGMDICLRVDPEKFRVIVDNLLSNAIKFSPENGVIRIRAVKVAENVTLDVADQGPGVAREDRERVFDAFYQGRQPPTLSLRGTGLGLSIAREHALAHGGGISIHDEEGGGACFRLILPRGIDEGTR